MPERFACFYGEGPSDRCWCVAVNMQCNCASVKTCAGTVKAHRLWHQSVHVQSFENVSFVKLVVCTSFDVCEDF